MIKLIWRFLTGAHMNGKEYNDSSWLHDASKRFQSRRHTYTWWRRKARWKRAAWRNCSFWTVTLITLGFLWSITLTLVCLAAVMPFIIWLAYGRIRRALFIPVVAHESDQSVNQRWIMKPKVRHALEMVKRPKDKRRRPGLAMPSELRPGIRLEEIPSELINAVRLEVSELGEQPPMELKLLMQPE